MLKALYSEVDWNPWEFRDPPSHLWKSKETRHKYYMWLSNQLEIDTIQKWDSISETDVIKNYGSGLIVKYSNCFPKLLQDMKSVWILKKGERHNNVTPLIDSNIKNPAIEDKFGNKDDCRDTIISVSWTDTFAKKKGIKRFSDWFKVSKFEADKENLSVLSANNHIVLQDKLSVIYPLFSWYTWSFSQVPQGYWKKDFNRHQYVEWLANQLQIGTVRDLHKINVNNIQHVIHGSKLSIFDLLNETLGDFNWDIWEYHNPPKHYWKSSINIVTKLSKLARELHIDTWNDWYRVSIQQVEWFNGLACIKYNKSLFYTLQIGYPWIKWDREKFLAIKKSSQRWLYLKTKEIFPPQTAIIEDYLFSHENSSKPVEFDIWIPEYRLALEYQGEQHYFGVKSRLDTAYSVRDKEKQKISNKHQITLIEIPYWWTGDKTSLCESILSKRLDLKPILHQTK
eukprot:TRINITY_DN1952_c0_g1_i5.p1 TRINITY_DN1952_c0_g1~~TRINITY_DN1952_c0_g1_i5.p1  ORF type:complete len:453 (-),score=35.59 TRINITY_DN1952_c0_g1_i5:3-1361(-)